MKRRIAFLVTLILVSILFTGCGGTNITKDSTSEDILNYLNKVENKDGSWMVGKNPGSFYFIPTGELGEACDTIDEFYWDYLSFGGSVEKCENADELAAYADAVELVSDRVIPRYAELSKELSEKWGQEVSLMCYTSDSEKGPIYWETNGVVKISYLW